MTKERVTICKAVYFGGTSKKTGNKFDIYTLGLLQAFGPEDRDTVRNGYSQSSFGADPYEVNVEKNIFDAACLLLRDSTIAVCDIEWTTRIGADKKRTSVPVSLSAAKPAAVSAARG